LTACSRRVLLAALAGLALLACHEPRGDRVAVIDLLRQSPSAEKRPLAGTFDLVEHQCGSVSRPSLDVPAASRVTWSLKLPDRAVLTTEVALEGPQGASAVFRVGISDDRFYKELEVRAVSADACGSTWTPIQVDLGAYSGLKFSLFYRPRHRTWRLVLGVLPETGAPSRALWGRPRIETDAGAAKRFYRR
jgi:hypothetical protein